MGPASAKKDVLLAMIRAGVNICRLNFSHGKAQDHKTVIDTIREINEQYKVNVGILADLETAQRTELAEVAAERVVGILAQLVLEAGRKLGRQFTLGEERVAPTSGNIRFRGEHGESWSAAARRAFLLTANLIRYGNSQGQAIEEIE